ncbi:MAG: lytic transglycosylase domain-containing protein [Proteobacteria bacterium]|nr:lytic transglycosylase domain-containing protein [Pseudomonadota bacterium]
MAAPTQRSLRLFCAAATLLALAATALAFSPPARAEIYRWVDEKGVIHFSDAPLHAGYRAMTWSKKKQTPAAIHPSLYDHLILTAADDHGLEFTLVKALIRVESSFNARAVSPSGAQGLMQLMPESCADLGVTDPFDPRQNIQGGCMYLKSLLDRFDNDIPMALAAYNAGPGAVERHKAIPPFPETQAFVKRVLKIHAQLSSRAAATSSLR